MPRSAYAVAFSMVVIVALISVPFAIAEDRPELFIPDNAHSPLMEPGPETSRDAGPNEFENRYNEGSLLLDIPAKSAAELTKLNEETRALEDSARRELLASRPELVSALLRLRTAGDVPFSIQSSRGENLQRALMGRNAAIRELVFARQTFASANHQLALFAALTARVPDATDLAAVDTSRLGPHELMLLNDILIARLEAQHGTDASDRGPREFGDCEAEEGAGSVGAGDNGDQTGRRCEPQPAGLLQGGDWALKKYNTCVRNQGERAVSVAFALTAAVESRVAVAERRLANLSEQHLISQMKLLWSRTPEEFSEGYAPTLSSGRERAFGYRFHFEDVWSYNPSYGRTSSRNAGATARLQFNNSCGKYTGRHCSDSAHQSRLLCTRVDEWRFCGYDAPMPAVTPIAIEHLSVIYDVTQPESGLRRARQLLRAKVPLVLTAGIPTSFRQQGNQGYIRASSRAAESWDGVHSLLVTGWVPNTRLPAGAPPAIGAGYFVAKNSWGTCAGDAGYLYLDEAWVRAHALNLTAVF
ncbi:MAG: hypothetical protein NDI61_02970 [Bdellovibrionaceae bacterium]|nr:hypothetical protein [Pseudobdellovibrionaceae bacterium]